MTKVGQNQRDILTLRVGLIKKNENMNISYHYVSCLII